MTRKQIDVVAAVIEHEGHYLITQRRANAVLPYLWEFPGGRVEPNESWEQALVREMQHRLGVDVVVGQQLGSHRHEYTHYDVVLTMFSCTIPEGQQPRALGVEDLRWVPSSDMSDYEFPPADERTMDKLLGFFAN